MVYYVNIKVKLLFRKPSQKINLSFFQSAAQPDIGGNRNTRTIKNYINQVFSNVFGIATDV